MTLLNKTRRVPIGAKGWLQWKANFKCDYCGNIVERLKSSGLTQKSCGCILQGDHRMSKTHIYKIWEDMKSRCDNPTNQSYPRYGGRGISYDPSWSEFKNFYRDMSQGYADKMTIDRIDVNGNYTKGNCQWLTKKENCGKDHKGRIQSKDWVNKRTKARIKIDEDKCRTMLEYTNKNRLSILKTSKYYGVTWDAFNNALIRYQLKDMIWNKK